MSDTTSSSQNFRTAIFDMMMESQHWSADQMLAFQRSQLEQLLRHAKATVPFYETRLDCLFTRHGEIDWDKWNEVPILTRKNIAQHFEALQSKQLPPGHGDTAAHSTAGSTGLPITIVHTRLMSDVCTALDWRAFARHRLDWSQPLVYWQKYDDAHRERGPRFDYGPWGPMSDAKSQRGQSYVINSDWPVEERLKQFQDVNAQHLIAPGNFAWAAATNLLDQRKNMPLQSVTTHGIGVDEQISRDIKSAFAVSPLALYSSKEGGRMAHKCAECENYHVNTEAVFIEILDDNNQPCPANVPGRLIVTNFFNAAQPFIRYEQGDIATWAEGCICGTNFPTIKRIDGRIYHLFKRRNGTAFAPQVPDDMRPLLDAAYWQFLQTDKNTITVKYKPNRTSDKELEQKFAQQLRQTLLEDFDVKFEIINQLPLTPAGKFLKYVYATK